MQYAYNEEHGITPQTVMKNVADILGACAASRRRNLEQRCTGVPLAEAPADDLNLEMAGSRGDALSGAGPAFERAACCADYLQTLHRQGLAPTSRPDFGPAPVN